MSKPTFVLIPGAGGDPWYWHLVVPKLLERGCGALPVALPASDPSAGLPEYADAVLEAIGDRDPARVVLVAQSMAGFTAPLVCDRLCVRMLVFLNAMIPQPNETPGAWFADTCQEDAKRQQAAREGRPGDAPFDPLVEFFHDVPKPVIEAAWARGEPVQSDKVFTSPCAFEHWPAAPIRVLAASHDRFFPAAFQRRIARERLGIEADDLPGGHLVALSQPDALVARLVSYVSAG
jgi:pimeloyl-ACP methyl ester carboxylesterase